MLHRSFTQQLQQTASGVALVTLASVLYCTAGKAQSIPSSPIPTPPSSVTPPPGNAFIPAGSGASSQAIQRFDQESYVLGPGDIVAIELFNQPDISKTYRVLIDGTVSMPLVGNVPVRGLTLDQASEIISSRYLRYFKRPQVTTRLENNRPITIAVSGEVFRPGTYAVGAAQTGATGGASVVSGQTNNITPKLTFAIQSAGGITPKSDIGKVQIRRQQGIGRADQVLKVDLWRIIKDGDLSQDVTLRDGDSIFIPEATEITPAEATRLALTTFSPSTINVNVVGEVRGPGTRQLLPNTPLNNAILSSGGFIPGRSNKTDVQLIRLNPDGTVSQRKISVDLARGIDPELNPTLQNNDVVIVGRSGLAAFSDSLSSILAPFNGITNIVTGGFGRFIPTP
jgi:polysaccharide biosynthesis/export protein